MSVVFSITPEPLMEVPERVVALAVPRVWPWSWCSIAKAIGGVGDDRHVILVGGRGGVG